MRVHVQEEREETSMNQLMQMPNERMWSQNSFAKREST